MLLKIAFIYALCWKFALAKLPGGFSPAVPHNSQYCLYTIYSELEGYSYANLTSSNGSQLTRRTKHASAETFGCTNHIEVMSIYGTAKLYCSTPELNMGIQYWEEDCKALKATLMDLGPTKQLATSEYLANLQRIDPDLNSTKSTDTLVEPAILTYDYYRRAYKTNTAHDAAPPKNIRYGWVLMSYFGLVLTLATIANFTSWLSERRWKPASQDIESPQSYSHRTPSSNAFEHWITTYITTPATFGTWSHHRQSWYWNTIPKRQDTLIVSGFYAMVLILCCVSYDTFLGNISYTGTIEQNWKYVSDRTAVLCYACMPLVWLFGMRNNVFIWTTGWNFDTFNIFHRHTARACVALGIVHSITKTVLYVVYDDKYQKSLGDNWFYLGIVATIVMSLMLVFSHDWIRLRFYETFLLTHISFAVVTIYSLWRHTRYDPFRYGSYLIAPCVFWVLDRITRLIRIAYCNIKVKSGKGFIELSTSSVTYNASSDVLKIEVQPTRNISPGPGQYYYLYQPFTLRGWENHPFTLGSYSSQEGEVREDGKDELRITTTSENSSTSGSSPTSQSLIFYIRPYDGWTTRLRKQCATSPTHTINSNLLLLEGPYGVHKSVSRFDTVLFIVGGTGISAAIPRIKESHPKQRAILVWTDKKKAFLQEIYQTEGLEDVEVQLYCTDKKDVEIPESSASSAEVGAFDKEITPFDKEINSGTATPCLRQGRPNINSIIASAAEEATKSSSSLAVLACGPASMADDCRAAVYEAMKNGCRNVTYIEESFGW